MTNMSHISFVTHHCLMQEQPMTEEIEIIEVGPSMTLRQSLEG